MKRHSQETYQCASRAAQALASILDRSRYKTDNYAVLSAFADLILVNRFGLNQNDSGTTETIACELAQQLLEAYDKALADLPPFTDILGPTYMHIQGSGAGKSLQEFYTPQEVSRCMALMMVADDEFSEPAITPANPISFCDPCVGSGAMPLAFLSVVLERHGPEALEKVCLYGQDLSYHGSRLYACQLLSNLAHYKLAVAEAVITQGNSLTMEQHRVLLHATHRDAKPIDPNSFDVSKSPQLRALAETTYSALEANGANLDELFRGGPVGELQTEI